VRRRQHRARLACRGGWVDTIEKNTPNEPADHALGRSRGGFGTKLHVVCCGNGVPLGVTISGGQAHESKHFEHVISTVRPKRRKPIWIAGDKGYSYPRVRRWCEARDIFDVIPQRSDQIEREGRRRLNALVYRGRNVVERVIGHLSRRTAASEPDSRSSPQASSACSSSRSYVDTPPFSIRQTEPNVIGCFLDPN